VVETNKRAVVALRTHGLKYELPEKGIEAVCKVSVPSVELSCRDLKLVCVSTYVFLNGWERDYVLPAVEGVVG